MGIIPYTDGFWTRSSGTDELPHFGRESVRVSISWLGDDDSESVHRVAFGLDAGVSELLWLESFKPAWWPRKGMYMVADSMATCNKFVLALYGHATLYRRGRPGIS